MTRTSPHPHSRIVSKQERGDPVTVTSQTLPPSVIPALRTRNESMANIIEVATRPFAHLSQLIADFADRQPNRHALRDATRSLTYAELHRETGRIAAALQRENQSPGSPIAIVAATDTVSVSIFLGALRAGCVPVPMPPTSTPEQLALMIADSGAALVFVDGESAASLPDISAKVILLDQLAHWTQGVDSAPAPVEIRPDDIFNIIYSSGTTGRPKGIIHTHGLRWNQIVGYAEAGIADMVMMICTPLYSNTTLVSLIPTLAYGGTAVLLGKFDALRFLHVAERERATHAMLVPVQYQRIMALDEFDAFDLSSFRLKTCTSAPFSADLKADVVRRWPGMLVEIYGMTEGGGSCLLFANDHPDKLHTVGRPAPGHDIRLIDPEGHEVPQGEVGEVVGRSDTMMVGYHGRPQDTLSSTWYDAEGNRFIRHGDLGRFDEDGFLVLIGRSKDVIISGGFNVYPSDIEAVMIDRPEVVDAAVIGVPSPEWGETPYGFYVTDGQRLASDVLVAWVNERVGKTQRLSGAEQIDELPRSAIGKVLKRDLRTRFDEATAQETGEV